MSNARTILIASPDLLPALRERIENGDEALTFPDTEPLRAIEAITRHRPQVVALERLFAATPRGAALIQRIRLDPALADCEIRVMSHDTPYTRVTPHPGGEAAAETEPAVPPPDQRGTRRAPRVRIREGVDVLIDGNWATLVDLSIIGAQVVGPAVLRPNQRVRLALTEGNATIRFNGVVAWAKFEMARTTAEPRYRAGLEFVNADSSRLEAFCVRHKE